MLARRMPYPVQARMSPTTMANAPSMRDPDQGQRDDIVENVESRLERRTNDGERAGPHADDELDDRHQRVHREHHDERPAHAECRAHQSIASSSAPLMYPVSGIVS